MTPYDPVPDPPPSGEPASAKTPAPKRSGSQKRQRCKKLEIALTPEKYDEVKALAAAAEMSASDWGYSIIFSRPGPRARRRPHVDKQLMGGGLAELNRSANVLNQFLPFLHAGKAITLGRECSEALAANRRAADAILEALGRKEPADDHQGEPAR